MPNKQPESRQDRRRRAWRAVTVTVAMIVTETVIMRRRGYAVGLHTVVRCRDGHLFTTIWIPGASLKSVRLGTVRLQYCPVGRHFTAVRPVKVADLTDESRAIAEAQHDVRVP